jgi:hypothetical protein
VIAGLEGSRVVVVVDAASYNLLAVLDSDNLLVVVVKEIT